MILLSVIAICVCGWSGKDQSVTSGPFHTVHTWRLLFDLQLLFAELVTVCHSASWAHLRPKSSSLSSAVPDCNQPACSVWGFLRVDSWQSIGNSFQSISVFCLPPSPFISPSHGWENKLFSILFTLNYGNFFLSKNSIFIVVSLLLCYV